LKGNGKARRAGPSPAGLQPGIRANLAALTASHGVPTSEGVRRFLECVGGTSSLTFFDIPPATVIRVAIFTRLPKCKERQGGLTSICLMNKNFVNSIEMHSDAESCQKMLFLSVWFFNHPLLRMEIKMQGK
jgi:hypothetical protein